MMTKIDKEARAKSATTAGEQSEPAMSRAELDRLGAAILTDGTCNAVVVKEYLTPTTGLGEVRAIAALGREQAKAVGAGDLSHLESMLLTQAVALQAMFSDLAVRAKRQDRFDGIQTMTTLALKCAAGSRQAITALAELRMPRSVMFAKQANVTSGPQQVNNGVVAPALPSRAEEIQDRPNELSGATHELLEDTRASRPAGGADPHLAAVGAIHRAPVTGR